MPIQDVRSYPTIKHYTLTNWEDNSNIIFVSGQQPDQPEPQPMHSMLYTCTSGISSMASMLLLARTAASS